MSRGRKIPINSRYSLVEKPANSSRGQSNSGAGTSSGTGRETLPGELPRTISGNICKRHLGVKTAGGTKKHRFLLPRSEQKKPIHSAAPALCRRASIRMAGFCLCKKPNCRACCFGSHSLIQRRFTDLQTRRECAQYGGQRSGNLSRARVRLARGSYCPSSPRPAR
jgi:hypothetical protein